MITLSKKYASKLILVAIACLIWVNAFAAEDSLSQKYVLVNIDSLHQKTAADIAAVESNSKETEHSVKLIGIFFMAPFLLVFSFGIFIWYRKKREHEFRRKEAEFKQQVTEVEMKALRAQIDPHFIFNCMNSVNNFMQQNDLSNASEYLIKFSKLIRQILENSENREIELKKDFETLELYMQMEQLRIPAGFDYYIKINETIDENEMRIPPMILQPFVENCIWHGLNTRESRGTISIAVTPENNMLKFTIEDNGTEISLEDYSPAYKKKSMGVKLTNERLEVLNKLKNSNAHFKISDIRNAQNKYLGKRVELWLPFE